MAGGSISNRWRALVLVLIVLFPVAIIVAVNENSPPPSHAYHPDHCTRYCHDHECPHFAADMKNNMARTQVLKELYEQNIAWLQSRPLGLSYREFNLLLYIILLPAALLAGIWGVLRRCRG